MPYARTTMQQQTKAPGQRQPVGSEKTIKQLLGELYGDRQYLEKILKETGMAYLSVVRLFMLEHKTHMKPYMYMFDIYYMKRVVTLKNE